MHTRKASGKKCELGADGNDENMNEPQRDCDGTSEPAGNDGVRSEELGAIGRGMGALLSNTAPPNYIPSDQGVTVLLYGVDSLYPSYPGRLSSQWGQRLDGLKAVARANDDKDRAYAQVKIGDHLLEVLGKGQGRFSYVLADNWYRIALASCNASSLPMAYVQIASELLMAVGLEDAEKALRYIVNTLGLVTEEPNVSRADLFIDCVAPFDMQWPIDCWLTRAQLADCHWVNRNFTGWSLGLGGVVSARLYDKTREILKSGKEYLKPLWAMRGWQEGMRVWRLEIQFKREALRELGVLKVHDLLPNLGGLWSYATQSWLRLVVPTNDENRSRWPNHPLWDCLSSIQWDSEPVRSLSRVRKERIPSDEALFINGLGALTSFMAREGISDLGEGFGEWLAHAEQFHALLARTGGKTLDRRVTDKVREKGKRYNTIRNEDPEAKGAIKREAQEYRKKKDGE